jgi:hypothetical protein
MSRETVTWRHECEVRARIVERQVPACLALVDAAYTRAAVAARPEMVARCRRGTRGGVDSPEAALAVLCCAAAMQCP